MGELSRRPPAALTRDTPAATAPVSAAAAGVARVEWTPVDQVGWDLMPEPALALLAGAGLCLGERVAAWATPARVRRLRAGGCVGDIEGWWSDTTSFIAVRGRRPLTPDPTNERRYHPTGTPWRVTAVAHRLTGTAQTQRWRKPPAPPATTNAGNQQLRHTKSVLDILPAAVQQQLGQPTEHGGARFYPTRGGYRERVEAYRRDPAPGGDQLLVVAAERHAGAFPDPEQAIADADWVITTLNGVLGPATAHDLYDSADPVAPGREQTPAAPLDLPPSRQITPTEGAQWNGAAQRRGR